MILSVSRRTDIPAFYSEWFFNRLRAGFVDVINPFNRKQVSRIPVTPDVVDCIVFWTKNPAPMFERLPELEQNYRYYFQFTITPYDRDVEPGLLRDQSKRDIIHTFQRLSTMIGSARTIWRYDPIFVGDGHSIDWHFDMFDRMLRELAPYTNRCVISFLDLYKKTEHNTRELGIRNLNGDEMRELALGFSQIAEDSGIEIQSCSEKIDLEEFGITHGACIDKDVIERLIGAEIDVKKDQTQRQECGCMTSIDIGQYDTCPHLCKYCYANFRPAIAQKNFEHHDSQSSLLFGQLLGDEKITPRKVKRLRLITQQQTSLNF